MTFEYNTKFLHVAEMIEKEFSEAAIARNGAIAVTEGAKILAEELGNTVPVVTGGLKKSITIGKVQRGEAGEHYVMITFEGTRNGLPYKFIAAKVEKGHVKDGDITHANPFIWRARSNCELQVYDAITQYLGEGEE